MNEWLNWRRRLQFSEQIVPICFAIYWESNDSVASVEFDAIENLLSLTCDFILVVVIHSIIVVYSQMTLTTWWMSIEPSILCVFLSVCMAMAIQSPFKSALFDIYNIQRLISRYLCGLAFTHYELRWFYGFSAYVNHWDCTAGFLLKIENHRTTDINSIFWSLTFVRYSSLNSPLILCTISPSIASEWCQCTLAAIDIFNLPNQLAHSKR